MPFVTEEVAHQLGYLKEGESIMRAAFPTGYTESEKTAWGLSAATYDFVNEKREAITALRAPAGAPSPCSLSVLTGG